MVDSQKFAYILQLEKQLLFVEVPLQRTYASIKFSRVRFFTVYMISFLLGDRADWTNKSSLDCGNISFAKIRDDVINLCKFFKFFITQDFLHVLRFMDICIRKIYSIPIPTRLTV